jgi:hypothetical protein
VHVKDVGTSAEYCRTACCACEIRKAGILPISQCLLTERTLVAWLLTGTTDSIKCILADSTDVVLILDVPHPVSYCAPFVDVHLHVGLWKSGCSTNLIESHEGKGEGARAVHGECRVGQSKSFDALSVDLLGRARS